MPKRCLAALLEPQLHLTEKEPLVLCSSAIKIREDSRLSEGEPHCFFRSRFRGDATSQMDKTSPGDGVFGIAVRQLWRLQKKRAGLGGPEVEHGGLFDFSVTALFQAERGNRNSGDSCDRLV